LAVVAAGRAEPHIFGFEHDYVVTGLAQVQRRRQPGKAGADHHHVGVRALIKGAKAGGWRGGGGP
jgi:hypothetical protein